MFTDKQAICLSLRPQAILMSCGTEGHCGRTLRRGTSIQLAMRVPGIPHCSWLDVQLLQLATCLLLLTWRPVSRCQT